MASRGGARVDDKQPADPDREGGGVKAAITAQVRPGNDSERSKLHVWKDAS